MAKVWGSRGAPVSRLVKPDVLVDPMSVPLVVTVTSTDESVSDEEMEC
jgi:hypothetical protein